MLIPMGIETRLTPLGKEIERHMKRRRMSQTALSEVAGIGQSTISKIMRGTVEPTPHSLNAIAQALGIDQSELYRLAGIPMPTPRNQRDSRVEYIAQRIDELLGDLKPHFQDGLIESVNNIVDAWEDMIASMPELYTREEPAPATPAAVAGEPAERRQLIENIRQLRDKYPADFADLLDEAESERPAATRRRASGK